MTSGITVNVRFLALLLYPSLHIQWLVLRGAYKKYDVSMNGLFIKRTLALLEVMKRYGMINAMIALQINHQF